MQSDIHRSSYWYKLTGILDARGHGIYEKNRKDLYEVLRPHMETAIANAKKLEAINEGKHPSDSSPGTMVHFLVEKLRPYLL